MNKNITHIGDNWKNLSIHIALAQDYPNATDYLCDAASNNLLAVTDEAGQVEEPLRYDPWGLRKDPLTWDTDFSGGLTDRGYTMHEHLDEFRLINMNGRIYDPVLGRFLSPDNYIQAPGNPQNYNRYSYALNNPLVYVDPDGEWLWLIPVAIGGIINVVSNWDHIQQVDNFWQGLGRGALYFAAGGANVGLSMTGVGGAIGGGALQSAANAAIRGEPINKVLIEAGIGGASNLVGYGIGAGTKSLTQTGVKALGIESKLATNISSNVAGSVLGTSSATTTSNLLHGRSFKESVRAGFDWKSIVFSSVLGAGIGVYETYGTTPSSQTPKQKDWDAWRDSYYGDEITPPEMPEPQLRTDLLPKSQFKPMPPVRPSGYWIHTFDDIYGHRGIWVDY